MAAGLPVVTSRINGASEMIIEGENGHVIEDPLDPSEIAAKIRSGLEIAGSRVADANQSILERLTWKHHLDQVLDLYETVRSEKGADRRRISP